MNMLKQFRDVKVVITSQQCADKFGMNLEDLHDECKPDTPAHIYHDSIYIIELAGNRFYSIVDRDEFETTTIAECEKAIYIAADFMVGWSKPDNTEEGLILEHKSFCENHGLKFMSADENHAELSVHHQWWLRKQLEDYISRWEEHV